jgi:cell division topological specificity factor
MKLLGFLRPIDSAPVARRRLQTLLDYERRSVSQTDLVALLREDILTIIGLYAAAKPCKVQIKVDRGAMTSRLAVDIEIPNWPRTAEAARA